MIIRENTYGQIAHNLEAETALSSLIENGDIIGPLVVKSKLKPGLWVLTGDVSYSRFRNGDAIDIRVSPGGDTSRKLFTHWRVVNTTYPAPGKIEIRLSGPAKDELIDNTEYFVFTAFTSKFNNDLIGRLKEVSLSVPTIIGDGHFSLATDNTDFKKLYENLNSGQKHAIDSLIDNNLTGAVQGPPGTGKTQLLQAAVSLALKSGMKIGVTSFTHSAIDNLLSRLINLDETINWFRIGEPHKIRTDLYKNSDTDHIDNHIINQFPHEEDYVQLLGLTLHKIALNSKTPIFDLLVVDEAGQVPVYFWPFIARITRRVILVGDKYQLPPVLSAKHRNLDSTDAFSLVVDESTPMLETQYRMHQDIQEWSSQKFYKGRLTPHESVRERNFFDTNSALLTDGVIVNCGFERVQNNSTAFAEAEFIANRIERLIKSNTPLNKVGIICPYRAQAGLINATLQEKIGVDNAAKILIDTVERFQGQEREAIFMSLSSSKNSNSSLDFLSDPKRLNVSVTRAKSKFYCLYDKELLRASKDSSDLNEFLKWVRDGTTKIRRAA